MAGESYTLREVAELLGVSKRTLQRRIKDGAFPRRFLSPGRHGLETRIPSEDVQQALQDLQQQTRYPKFAVSQAPASPAAKPSPQTVTPPYPSSVTEYSSSVSMTVSDLENFRESMLEAVREEREAFLDTLRSALTARDRELDGLREQVSQLESVIVVLQDKLQTQFDSQPRLEAPDQAPSLLPARIDSGSDVSEDVQSVLQEIEELEALLGLWSQTPN